MNNIATYEAIAEVFLKNKHRLYYIAYSYVSSAYIVEEIVADTLLAVLEKAPIFTSEKQCLCYIKQAVRNRAISYLRKKYVGEPNEEQDIERVIIEQNNSNLSFNEVDVQLLLNDILKEYPEEIRNAFIAHVIDQETIPNLAACYGINPSTLRKQIKRMKDRIAEKIPEKNMKEFLFMLMLFSW